MQQFYRKPDSFYVTIIPGGQMVGFRYFNEYGYTGYAANGAYDKYPPP